MPGFHEKQLRENHGMIKRLPLILHQKTIP